MAAKTEWVIGSRGEPQAKEQIEHIPMLRAQKDGPDEETVRLWNLMVKTLRDNGLMRAK